jgi:hypothetical protein
MTSAVTTSTPRVISFGLEPRGKRAASLNCTKRVQQLAPRIPVPAASLTLENVELFEERDTLSQEIELYDEAEEILTGIRLCHSGEATFKHDAFSFLYRYNAQSLEKAIQKYLNYFGCNSIRTAGDLIGFMRQHGRFPKELAARVGDHALMLTHLLYCYDLFLQKGAPCFKSAQIRQLFNFSSRIPIRAGSNLQRL